MLPRSLRLCSADIRRVLKTGKRKILPEFLLIYLPSFQPRFAIIVPKKIDKRAAVRNRNKRLLREAIRNSTLPKKPIDGVFLVRKSIADIPLREIAGKIGDI